MELETTDSVALIFATSSPPSSSNLINQTALPSNLTEQDIEKLLYDFYTSSNFSPPVETVLILVYSILTILGFLFNFLMMLVILKSETLRRMPFNLLLLNLCSANILMSVFCMPFTLIGFLSRRWTLGPALCKIIPTLQVMASSFQFTCSLFP